MWSLNALTRAGIRRRDVEGAENGSMGRGGDGGTEGGGAAVMLR